MSESPMPSLRLTCLDMDATRIFIEPWGNEILLRAGEALTVNSNGFLTGHVEVSVVPEGVVIGFTSNAEMEVLDERGNVLAP